MESKSEKEQLVEELLVIGTLIGENPCRMPNGVMGAMREVLRSFFGKYCVEGASKDQVARYLGRSVRTITRWMELYPDFPCARHDGHKEVTFNWMEVVRWKLKHKDLVDSKENK